MIYLATRNNAAQVGEQSAARMRQAQLGHSVRALEQQSTPARTVRRIIGATPELVADLGQVDSGDPVTVIEFTRWTAETAPAERYMLVMMADQCAWRSHAIR